jgi:hypothetical protein
VLYTALYKIINTYSTILIGYMPRFPLEHSIIAYSFYNLYFVI